MLLLKGQRIKGKGGRGKDWGKSWRLGLMLERGRSENKEESS